jgi:hypothetical protein
MVVNSKLEYCYGNFKRDLFASIYGEDKYRALCSRIHNICKDPEVHLQPEKYFVRHNKRINFLMRLKYKL